MIELKLNPTDRELRVFAVGLVLFAVLVCGIHGYRHGNWQPLWILGPLALLLAGVGLAVPRAIRWLYVAWMVALFPIAWVTSTLLLALVFFGVLMPIGWLLKWTGRQPLPLQNESARETDWEPVPQREESPERYFRQF
ncbi:SxtJ family membrane protein [Planctomicrobium sp. SH664]|uniref:SxtJ family membrane protein n=1 Tax=Planctomicrobium sp. SH664 TaxID=3448125 RepID=UPI003F5B095A